MDAVNLLTLKGALLRWARISLQNAAEAIGVSATTLGKWGSSQAKIPSRLLERIADTYKRSTAVFFMPSVPADPPTPIDFRVMVPGMREILTEKTVLALRRARWLQNVFIDLIRQGGDYQVKLLPLTVKDDPVFASASARTFLGASLDEQSSHKRPAVALPVWRQKIEATGVLVFQFAMSLKEARGFSLPGAVPAIVLNSVDEPAGRIFTLFHEWAHLCVGQPGLCNPTSTAQISQQGDAELFCNRFAGNFLVPPDAASSIKPVSRYKEGKVSLSYALGRIAGHFAVSRQVALQVLYSLGIVSQKAFEDTHVAGGSRRKSLQDARSQKHELGLAMARKTNSSAWNALRGRCSRCASARTRNGCRCV